MTVWRHCISGRVRLGLLTLAIILLCLFSLYFFLPTETSARSGRNSSDAFIRWRCTFRSRSSSWCRSWNWPGEVTAFPICASLSSFVLGTGDARRHRGSTSRMVPGAKRRVFWTAGHPAHVGRDFTRGRLLAVLDVARAHGGALGLLYAVALALAVGLVAWTGYRGGQLSLGKDHLTEHMPTRLRHMLGLSDAVRRHRRAPIRIPFMARGFNPFSRHAASPATAQANTKRTCGSIAMDRSCEVARMDPSFGPGMCKAAIWFVESHCLPATMISCPRKASGLCPSIR